MVKSSIDPQPLRRKVRVLCVDDNRDLTAALQRCIERESDMECVGVLYSPADLVIQVSERHPDVVLLDLTMPGADPLAMLRELAVAGNGRREVRVIVFSGRCDQKSVDMVADAGACGFLSKDAEVPVILGAIREVARWNSDQVSFGVWR